MGVQMPLLLVIDEYDMEIQKNDECLICLVKIVGKRERQGYTRK